MSVLFGPVAALWTRLGALPYDAMYRRGAPWDTGPREELVALLDSGRLTRAVGPRALDVGCGTGADCRLLAEHGFEVTGVDFSEVAIGRAQAAGGTPRYVQADLFALPTEVTREPFDLIFDGGTIDDLTPAGQQQAARIVTGLARPGGVLVMWCFSIHRDDAPWFSLNGPSRLGGMGITPEQVDALFGEHWDIEDLPTAQASERAACYWMSRRSATGGLGGSP
jgi:SAM-dependent methyltransferase